MRLRTQAGLVFLVSLTIYLLTLSQNLAIAHDSSVYMRWIEERENLFMPHHLLYTITMRLWLTACELIFPAGDDVMFVTLPNAIAGALGAAVIYLILRRNARVSAPVALAGTAGGALSFGFWFYSVAVEVYLIPLFFLLVALYYVSKPDLKTSDLWKIGIAHALGILFHQAHVLMFPAIAVALMFRSKELNSTRFSVLIRYTLWSAIPTIGVYLAAMIFYAGATTAQEGWWWLTLYSHELGDSWNPLAFSTLIKACIGFGRAFIGAHFVFAIPSMREGVTANLKGHWFDDEIFLVQGLGSAAATVWLVLAILAFVALVFLAVKILRSKVLSNAKVIVLPIVLWLAAYCIFFFFWDATNCEFWIPQAVCVWMLFAIGVEHLKSRTALVALSFAALVVGIVNYGGSIQFAQSKDRDYYYHRIKPFLKSSSRDLVVLSNSWTIDQYFHYFTPVSTTSIQELFNLARDAGSATPTEYAASELRSRIDSTVAEGGTVFVMGDAIRLSEVALLQARTRQGQVDSVWMGFRDCLIPQIMGIDTLYVYRCP